MYKRIAITTAALAVSFAAAAPSLAGSGHVSQSTYNHVQVGESKADVQKAFGTHGQRFTQTANKYGTRTWKVYAADSTHAVYVTFLHVKGTRGSVVIDSHWCTHAPGQLGCS